MVKGLINGLHHVTSLSGSAKNNARFYTEILGLRFVKKTVNYDSPDTWHLYYGSREGSPGSVTTFFPFADITRGKSGNKSVISTMYSIGSNSIAFWMNRLKTHQIEFRGPIYRFNEEYIHFEDFDGIHIELVANNSDKRKGCQTAGIPEEHGIKGLYSLTLSYASIEPTLEFFNRHLEHLIATESEERIRLFSGERLPGHYLDFVSRPSVPSYLPGTGTVHHIAFQTPNQQTQDQIRNQLLRAGFQASPVMDRQYFKSVYLREPGGIHLEIATAGPGFLVDEPLERLGEALKLPLWLEDKRDEIQAGLSSL
jgi:glyoxalase family protein